MENSKDQGDLLKRYEALQAMAIDLMQVKKPRELLSLILNRASDLLSCDAGSLYIKHNDQELIFEVAVNRSIRVDLERRIIPMDAPGLATHSFRSGQALSISDVYALDETKPFAFDTKFDSMSGYRTKSVLLVPLMSTKGERLGVLQLINRKPYASLTWPSANEDEIAKMPDFSSEDARLADSFAALASASLENANLYKSIENLFEGFVYASVGAIESRDRATRGHSERVAILSVELAQQVSRSMDPDLRGITFNPGQISELRYAALLHDFGKIGVREQTLMKSEKLTQPERETIRHRMSEFASAKEIQELRRLIMHLLDEARAPIELDLANVDRNVRKFRNKIDEYWDTILDLNQPTILDEDKTKILEALQNVELMAANGTLQKLLQPGEAASLSIKRGSLSPTERREIEEHVTRTYLFLKEIPWTKDFQNVADIAHAHHEKLDGSGYPRRVRESDIPLPSRIMTICDIFDALVASDRPYKRAVPFDKALAILSDEVKLGKLDARFMRVFLEAKVFESPEFVALTGTPLKKVA
jgi:HD-GYP domain-containing protein (c-di-GMP phosphodiesterase class II)